MENVPNANGIQNNLLTLIVAETPQEKNDCYKNIISCYMVEENGSSEDIEPICINDPENLTILVDCINRDIMIKEKMLQAKLLNVLSWLLSCIWVHEINSRLLQTSPYSFVDTHPELNSILMKLEFSIKEIINYFSEHSKPVDMHLMDPIIILTLFLLEKQLVPALFGPHLNTIIPIISTIISSQDIHRIPENISQISQSAPLPVKKWIMGFKTLNNLTILYGKEKGLDINSTEMAEKSIFTEFNRDFLEYLFHCVVHIVTAGSIITKNNSNSSSNSNISSNVDKISGILSAVSCEDQQMVLRVAVRILSKSVFTTSMQQNSGIYSNSNSSSNSSNTVDVASTAALLNVVSLAHDNVAGICEYISNTIKSASQLRKTSNSNLNNLTTTESINNEEWSVSAAGAEENSNPESDKNNTIRMCCDLWRLVVMVLGQMMCVENYIPASSNKNNNINNSGDNNKSGSNTSSSSNSRSSDVFWCVSSAEKGKALFVKLITPNSGVGLLAAPLQGILKVSRVLAAECYLSLASVLVLNQEWFSPSAPLKLLLRLLHNILFTPLPSSNSSTQNKQNKLSKKLTKKQTVVGSVVQSEVAVATVSRAQNTNVTNNIISVKQRLANEEHVKSIEIAGQALYILCGHIPRSRMSDVLNISIPITTPSAAKTNSPATPFAATTTSVTTATAIESNKISIQLIINKLQSTNMMSTTTVNDNTDSIIVRDTRKIIASQCVSALFANDLRYLQGTNTTQPSTPNASNVHKENAVLLEKGLFSQDKLFTRVNKNNNNSNNAIGCNDALSRLLMLSNGFESLATVTTIHNNSHANQNNNNSSNTDNIKSNTINNSSTAVDNLSVHNSSISYNTVVTKLTVSWQFAILTLTQSLFTELATLASNQLGTQQHTQNNTQNTQNMCGGAVPVYQYTQFDSQPFSLFSQQLNYNNNSGSGNNDANLGESPSKGNPLLSGVAAASKKRKLDKQAHDSFLSDSEPDASPDISFVDSYLSPNVTSPHKIPRHNNTSNNSSNNKNNNCGNNNNTSSSSISNDNAQFVLCSAYPPAVEITIKLFKIAIKIWTGFWDSNNNHAYAAARTMFIESLWWFLHRTTGFNCDLSEECRAEFSTLSERILKGCGIDCTLCPRNAVGCLFLLTILHTNCHAANGNTEDNKIDTSITSTSDTAIQSLFDAHKPLYRALRRSINSMTESATLPPLLEWIPSVLAVHCAGDSVGTGVSACSSNSNSSSGNSGICASGIVSTDVMCATITVNSSTTNSNSNSDSSANTGINKHLNPALTIFLSRFLRESLQQLSAMILPSPSEQQDEDLVRSMANGLRNLLICPVIYMISNNQLGMKYLFGSSSVGNIGGSSGPLDTIVKKHSGGNVGSDNAVLSNWRKLFTLFLTLEDVRQAHNSAGNSNNSSNNSSNNNDNNSSNNDNNSSSGDWLSGVFTTLNNISAVPFTAPTADSSNSLEYFNTLQLSLQLISTAAEVTIAHKNRHNQHNQQNNTNNYKTNNIHSVLQYLRILLVNALSGAQVTIVSSSQGTDGSSVQMMEVVSELLDVTLPLIQKLCQNRISNSGSDVTIIVNSNINSSISNNSSNNNSGNSTNNTNKNNNSSNKAQHFQSVILSTMFNILSVLLVQVDSAYKAQLTDNININSNNISVFKTTEKLYDSVRKWIYSALTVHSTIYSQLKNTTTNGSNKLNSNNNNNNNNNNSSNVKSIMSELQLVLHVFATTITPLVAVPISSLTANAVILKHNKANYDLFEYINTALIECGVAKIVPPEVSAVSSNVASGAINSVVDLTDLPTNISAAAATTSTTTPGKTDTSTTATTSISGNSTTKIFDSASKRSFIPVDAANTANINSDYSSSNNNNNSSVKRPRDNNTTASSTSSSNGNINKQLFPSTRDEEQPDAKYLKLGTLSESELVRLAKRAMGEPSQATQSQSQAQPASPQPVPRQPDSPQQKSSQPQAALQLELEAEEKEIVAEPTTADKEVTEVVPSDQVDMAMEVVEEGGDVADIEMVSVEPELSLPEVATVCAAVKTAVDTQVIVAAAEATDIMDNIGNNSHSDASHSFVCSSATSSSSTTATSFSTIQLTLLPAVLGDKMVRTATDQMIERLNTHELFPGSTFNMPDSVILPDTPPDYDLLSPLNVAASKQVTAGVASMAATTTTLGQSAPTTMNSVLKRSLLPPLSSLPSILPLPPPLALQPQLPQLQSPAGSVIVVNSQSSQSSHQSQSQHAIDSQQSQHQDSQQFDSQELESQSVLDLHDVPELSPSAVAGADVVVDHSQGSGLEIGSEGFADVANVLLTLSGSINKSGNVDVATIGNGAMGDAKAGEVVVVESTPVAQLPQSTATEAPPIVLLDDEIAVAVVAAEAAVKAQSSVAKFAEGNNNDHNEHKADSDNMNGSSEKSVVIDSQATVAEDVDSQDKLTRQDSLPSQHSCVAQTGIEEGNYNQSVDAELTKVASCGEPCAIGVEMDVGDEDDTSALNDVPEQNYVHEAVHSAVAADQSKLRTSQQQQPSEQQTSQLQQPDTLSRRSTAGSFSFATPRTTQQAEALLRGILRDHHDVLAADSAGEMMMHRQATTQYSDSFLQIGPSGSEKSENKEGLAALAASGAHDIVVKSGLSTVTMEATSTAAAEGAEIAHASVINVYLTPSGNAATVTIPDACGVSTTMNDIHKGVAAAEEEQEDVDMHIAESDELPADKSEASEDSRESQYDKEKAVDVKENAEGDKEKVSSDVSVSGKNDKAVENIAAESAVWMEDEDNEAEHIDRETAAAVDNSLFQTFVSQFEEREQRAAAASRQKAAQPKAHLQGNVNTNSSSINSTSGSSSSSGGNVNSTTTTTTPSTIALSTLLHSLNNTLAEAVTAIAQHTQHTQQSHTTTTSQQNSASVASEPQQGGRNISSEDREAVARAWHKTHELNKLLFDLMQRK